MPLRASAVLTGHVVASLLRNLVATGVVIGVALLVGFRPTADVVGLDRRDRRSSRCTSSRSPTCSRRSGSPPAARRRASGYGFIILFLPYLSSAFVPVDDHAGVAAVDRREPAGHADHRDDPRAADGHADRTASAWWGVGWCLGILASSFVVGRVAVPPQGGGRAAEARDAASVAGQRPGSFLSAFSIACFADAAARPTTSAAWAAESGSGRSPPSRPRRSVSSQERAPASRRPRRAARPTGCSSGAGPLRAPRRAPPRAAP